MKTKIYLVKFTNVKTGEETLEAVGDIYDTVLSPAMKYEVEYKDVSSIVLEDGFTCEKKEKEVFW